MGFYKKRCHIMRALLCLLLVLLISLPARADQLQDAYAAYYHKDYQTAFKLAKPLSDQGNAKAEILLGMLYERGYAVKQDPSAALKLYRTAAKHGDAGAEMMLGNTYRRGLLGVQQSDADAATWWRKAIEHGQYSLEPELAGLYQQKKDYVQAAKWWRKAADRGDSYAAFNLSPLYAHGQGVKKSYEEACFWLGASNPKIDCTQIYTSLTASERNAVKTRLAAWRKTHPCHCGGEAKHSP